MDFKRTIRVEISKGELQKIVADHVSKEIGHTVEPKNVNFSVGTRLEGYGMAEHSTTYFDGCTVTYNEG